MYQTPAKTAGELVSYQNFHRTMRLNLPRSSKKRRNGGGRALAQKRVSCLRAAGGCTTSALPCVDSELALLMQPVYTNIPALLTVQPASSSS